MRIGIDFDDVVTDSVRAIITLHNRKYGTNFKREDVSRYRMHEIWGGTREEWREKLDDFFSVKYLTNLYPMAGALRGIAALKNQGHELYIITGRGAGDIPATEQWIEAHFPDVFRGIHYCNIVTSPEKGIARREKSEICKENNIELMIDDNPDFAEELAVAGIKVLLFDQPWNRAQQFPANVKRVSSWDEIVESLSR